VLTKEAHRLMPPQQISRSNDGYDALPSSAHPMVLNNGTTQEKTIFVRPLNSPDQATL